MTKRLLTIVGLLAASALAWTAQSSAEDKAVALGETAPAFSLTDQAGKQVNLSDYAGKIVVLEWLNPGCPFVQRHYKSKTMVNLASKYQDKNVVWLAINSTSSADSKANASWVTENALAYPILDDHDGKVGRLYGAKTTPHLFIIDASGKLAYHGGIDSDASGEEKEPTNYVDKALGELTEGKAVTVSETKSYGCSVKYSS